MPQVRIPHGSRSISRRTLARRSRMAIALGAACWLKFGTVVAAQSIHHHQPHPYGHAFLPNQQHAVQVPFAEQLEPQPSLAQHLNQLGRILGIGYGDGYHAAPPRPTRFSEDLPPRQSLPLTGPTGTVTHANQSPHCEALPPDWFTHHDPQPLPSANGFVEPDRDQTQAMDESVLNTPSPSDLLPPALLAPTQRNLLPQAAPPVTRPTPTPMPPDRIAPQPIAPQPPITRPADRLPAPDSSPSDRGGPEAVNSQQTPSRSAPIGPLPSVMPSVPARPNLNPYEPRIPDNSQPPANDPLDGSLLPEGKDPYRDLPSDPLQDFRPASTRRYVPAARPNNLQPRPRRLPTIRPRPPF